MIAIIDYDAGNIKSVEKAMQLLGQEVIITRDRETIMNADKVILPGVGAFGDAMEKLRSYGLDKVIYEVVEKKIPFLGRQRELLSWESVLVYSYYLNEVMRRRAWKDLEF